MLPKQPHLALDQLLAPFHTAHLRKDIGFLPMAFLVTPEGLRPVEPWLG